MDSVIWLLALLGLSTLLGLLWKARQGRVRRKVSGEIPPSLVSPDAKLTLLQFSSEYCSYCPLMRSHLGRLAEQMSAVEHIETDVARHPELTAKLHILQTPTTLLVSPAGRILARIGGVAAPKKLQQEIEAALAVAQKESDDYLI